MISSADAIDAIGPAVFELVRRGDEHGVDVGDVFLAEPHVGAIGQPGDLVLGVGLPTAAAAASLVRRCAESKASGLVLRLPLAREPEVVAEAAAHGLLLAGLRPDLPWAHVVWMLRGVIDRAAAPDAPAAGDAAVHSDLFALADAAAAIIDAPVTIEDNQSRVLAYSSSGQAAADPARVSTIVGRRVPPEVVAHFRARGVFRRLARSSEPFLVPEGPEGTRPRLVVPVRAGDEWLGSIWAVVDGAVPDDALAELSSAASVLALHLLRLRAQADVARRTAVERLRGLLVGGAPVPEPVLPPAPWRVVALSAAGAGADAQHQADLWNTTARRHGWAEPLLADVDGGVYAVVTDGTGPGSWPWLEQLVGQAHDEDPGVRAAAGAPVADRAELARSRAQAAELLHVVVDEPRPSMTFEAAWAALTVHRAARAVGQVAGPPAVLLAHDEARGTAYLPTLGAWLAHPGEPQLAARELHVHTNTLRHRMRRIHELVDLDLADPRSRLALQLQVEALRRAATGTAAR